ncbi:MAG: hypothetical protein AAGK32_20230, partial [Actinomycetota bacterium]
RRPPGSATRWSPSACWPGSAPPGRPATNGDGPPVPLDHDRGPAQSVPNPASTQTATSESPNPAAGGVPRSGPGVLARAGAAGSVLVTVALVAWLRRRSSGPGPAAGS